MSGGLSLLAGAIYLFMTNKVRMDVVAQGGVILFVLSGTLTLLAAFLSPGDKSRKACSE